MGLNKDRLQQLMDNAASKSQQKKEPLPAHAALPTGTTELKLNVQKPDAIKEDVEQRIEMIPPERLHPFHTGEKGHTFRINQNKIEELRPSIVENGILQPLTVRIDKEQRGDFEIIAGHHRWTLALELGIPCPCIIKNVDDDTAIIMMVHTNKQRGFEAMLPSEICESLVAERAAKSRQGKRSDLIIDPDDDKEEDQKAMSTTNENRYLRLQYLILEFVTQVDNGTIGLRTAVQLSFLSTQTQARLYKYCYENRIHIQLSKAEQLRKAAKNGELTETGIRNCFEKKKPALSKKAKTMKISLMKLTPFFDFENVTKEEIETAIVLALKSMQEKDKTE